MKIINKEKIINNKQLMILLKYMFDVIKQKIENKDIIKNNLDKKRNKNEQLIDTFNGEMANIITKYFLKKNINNNYSIIDYNNVRIDNNKYPDLFDLIVVEKKFEQDFLNKLNNFLIKNQKRYNEKNIENYGIINFQIQKNLFKYLKEIDYKVYEIEVKSSAIKNYDNILDKPIISYCLDKNYNTFVNKYKTTHPLHIDEYLSLRYKNLDIENARKKYLNENFFIKDIHSQIFYTSFKDKLIYKKFSNKDFVSITFEDIIDILPEKWYYDIFTIKEKFIDDSVYIGLLSQKLKAIYHLNKIKDIGFDVNYLNNKLFGGKFVYDNKKNINNNKNLFKQKIT